MPDKPSSPKAAQPHVKSDGGDDEQSPSERLAVRGGSDGNERVSNDHGSDENDADERGSDDDRASEDDGACELYSSPAHDEQLYSKMPDAAVQFPSGKGLAGDWGDGADAPEAGASTDFEERPAKYAREPYFDADNAPLTPDSFAKQQLGANFHAFLDTGIDGDFARENDSQLYFATPEPIEPEAVTHDLSLLVPPRKATAWAAIIVAIVGFTWFGKTLSNVLAPMALAAFLGYLIVPMAGMFSRLKVPRWMGYVMSSLVIAACFFSVGVVISSSVAKFRSNFPDYEQNLDAQMARLTSFARNLGLIGSGDSLSVQDVIESLPGGGMQGIVSGGAAYMFEFMSYFVVTTIFLMFMIWEAERFSDRVRGAYSHGAAERVLAVVHRMNGDIQRYVLLKVGVSVITAALAFVVMKFCGLDFAGVLALIIFLANFIPYIGSIVATLVPGVVAMLQFSTWSEGIVIVVLITLVQQIIGNIVEPRLQGRSLNVSPLIILIALAYFGWMWGIVGMIVSVPIAAGFRLIFDQFELTRPMAQMMRNL